GSTDFRLLADKAYSHPSTRAALRSKKIKHTIPERQDQIDRRKAKGSAGGRPPAFDAALYGLRNTVERGFHRLKQWRGIATRYDKYALGSTDFRLLADKAYSHPSTRAALRSKKIKHTIPERQDQIDRRKAKGSAGGRPPAFDAALYGLRNTVERGFHRLKQWRGIATRYDKYALTYLGGVLLACAVIHARVGTPKLGDTP
ncbi:transposase, partial [Mycobacterium tuberculosis]|uniref:transposase n=1 Tax=Mycobacterium tuberculosis TaxID=1773 RepID=UPI0009319359